MICQNSTVELRKQIFREKVYVTWLRKKADWQGYQNVYNMLIRSKKEKVKKPF